MLNNFHGNIENMKKIVYDMIKQSMTIESHDLFLTGAQTTAFVQNGRSLHTIPEFFELNEFILSCCREFHDNIKIVMSWANVYPTGSYIRPHRHITFDNLISAVFYLQGNGILHIGDKAEYINDKQIIFFKSDIEHWSEPNNNKEDRIMIGYDLYYGNKTDKEIKKIIENFGN